MEIKTNQDGADYLLEHYSNIPLCVSVANKIKNKQKIFPEEKKALQELFEFYANGFNKAIREHERYGKASKANSKAAKDLQSVNLENDYKRILSIINEN